MLRASCTLLSECGMAATNWPAVIVCVCVKGVTNQATVKQLESVGNNDSLQLKCRTEVFKGYKLKNLMWQTTILRLFADREATEEKARESSRSMNNTTHWKRCIKKLLTIMSDLARRLRVYTV